MHTTDHQLNQLLAAKDQIDLVFTTTSDHQQRLDAILTFGNQRGESGGPIVNSDYQADITWWLFNHYLKHITQPVSYFNRDHQCTQTIPHEYTYPPDQPPQ